MNDGEVVQMKKKNIIITAVMIVLVAIIAIVLVKINSSNVK